MKSTSRTTFTWGQNLQHILGPARILVFSFAGAIFIATFLLLLPFSHLKPVSFIDALFTITSAICVTGLTVVDTGTTFTLFGQIVILVMIQLGGLGVMTFSTFFVYLLGGKLSLGNRELLQETLSQAPMKNLKALLKTVFLATFIIEMLGALLLTLRWSRDLPLPSAIYHGVFHAVSAFCNAGFALFPNNMESYTGDFIVNFTLTTLIILGGLGFVVIFEIMRKRKQGPRRLSLHARLVLRSSGLLVFGGMALLLVFEYGNAIEDLPWSAKLWGAYFQSVSARTAGFNTINLGALSDASLFLLLLLMFIGASPGSCGGGIKTTTFAILLAFIKARFHNLSDANLLQRRIPEETVSKAIAIFFFSLSLILTFTVLLLLAETQLVSHQMSRGIFLELLFEVTSAFGTVGLSVNVTPTLSEVSRLLITLVMFIGRLGPLTIAIAVGGEKKARFQYAQENVLVG
ncbi:MAG: TrkH family potassium uptake protein [candidate division KSB1 bacterium]